MAWTNIAKPASSSYMNVNPQGKEQYDQSTLTYDDVSTFYDGVDLSQWTNIAKPVTPTWTNIAKPI